MTPPAGVGGAGEPGEPGAPARLLYLYVGSEDLERDLRWWNEAVSAVQVWRYQAFGTDVAGLRVGDGPMVVLAGHRPTPSVLPIWAVEDLSAALQWAHVAGWTVAPRQVGVPEGPCLVLTDPSGNQLGLLRQDRPGALEPT